MAEVLGELEGAPGSFDAMLEPFDFMVETQLEHVERRSGPSRFKRKRHREPKIPAWQHTLRERWNDLVLLYAEANVWGHCESTWYPSELLHWVAVRPSTGTRFEAVVRTQNPLGPNTPFHLEVPAERLLLGAPLEDELRRFESFLRPTDLLAGWGHHSLGLLKGAGAPNLPWLELRSAVTQVLNSRTQGLEDAVDQLRSNPKEIWALGRAGRRIVALERIVETLTSGR